MTRRRTGGRVRLDYLQVPEDLLRVRSGTLAKLLTAAKGKRVTQGDALLIVLRLWEWVLSQVDESALDLKAEFDVKAALSRAKAEQLWPEVAEWPEPRAAALIDALADRHVAVISLDGDMVRVLALPERYLRLAAKQSESKGRARASYLAKQHGWKPGEGGGWMHPTTGESVDNWRELIALLEAK